MGRLWRSYSCRSHTHIHSDACRREVRLIIAARYPAPKPLSMLTTPMPGAQLLSMASSAAIPPKLAPYPTLVGTATIGVSTSPPTTEGSAPSIPATTTSARQCRSLGRWSSSRCKPDTPTSGYTLHLATDQLGGNRGLGRHPEIGGSSGQDGYSWNTGLVDPTVDDNTTCDLVVPCIIDLLPGGLERVSGGSGHEEAVGTSQDRGRNGRDLLRRLSLSKHNLWKALPNRPVVIDLGELDVLVRQVPQLCDHLVDGKTAFAELLKYGAQPGLFDD